MTSLALKNVSFIVPQVEKPIINNISYSIAPGEFIILLGSNGSGKSSLLKLLTKHYSPSQGNILLNEKPLSAIHPKEFSQRVAILTQYTDDSLFPNLTIYENYLLVKTKSILNRIHQQTERQFLQNHLLQYNPRLAQKLDTPISALSGGEKQALALALCFLQPPELLLLDEHTSALDPKASLEIMRLTHEKVTHKRMTCILTTHDLDIALQYGDRMLMLSEGKIHKVVEQQEKFNLTREILINYYH